MGWLHALFGAHPPELLPENQQTLDLLQRVRSLSKSARSALPDRAALTARASEVAWNRGFGDHETLVELLTRLAEALVDAATTEAVPNDLTVETALKDVVAGVELRERLRDTLDYLRDVERHHALLEDVLWGVLSAVADLLSAPSEDRTGPTPFRVPLLTYVEDPADFLSDTVGRLYWDDVRATPLFRKLRDQLTDNLDAVFERHRTNNIKEVVKKYDTTEDFITAVTHDTPFLEFFTTTLPFHIPRASRFEHMHILGGSGHGKTQCLQLLLLEDLTRAAQETFGFALLDSQGDLIGKLTRLNVFDVEHGALSNRLILIDPNDLSHPVALNLFDYNLERFKHFEAAEREKIFHGVLELYSYIFSSLLGAELTQKQGVVFTNLARAMLVLPKPNIFTFYDFVEDGRQFQDVIEQLDPIPRRFFKTQFFTGTYSETRKQIITRLLGILSQPVFEKMFGSEENKIDLFGAMQDGKIIVINTAKDLLKSDGSSLFGRFFIALIAQATVARAVLPIQERTPFHLYIDEAQEYLDHKTAELFNQGRKYHVGVTVAHQNLNQLTPELRAALHASTAIKLVGGANHQDSAQFAREMNTTTEHIQSMRKRAHATEFACFVRHHTPRAITLTVPFGVLERVPAMTAPAYMAFLEGNRARVSGSPRIGSGPAPASDSTPEAAPGEQREAQPADAPEKTPAAQTPPTSSRRAPKDDLDFYID